MKANRREKEEEKEEERETTALLSAINQGISLPYLSHFGTCLMDGRKASAFVLVVYVEPERCSQEGSQGKRFSKKGPLKSRRIKVQNGALFCLLDLFLEKKIFILIYYTTAVIMRDFEGLYFLLRRTIS